MSIVEEKERGSKSSRFKSSRKRKKLWRRGVLFSKFSVEAPQAMSTLTESRERDRQ
jgi:hypothetical protein